jgi:hypothetical protein
MMSWPQHGRRALDIVRAAPEQRQRVPETPIFDPSQGGRSMPFVRLVALACLSALVTGCINSATLLKIKPDGSGTIEQTMLMNMQALRPMMQGLEQQGAKPAGPAINEADLKRAAERMGGVTYVSGEPVKGPNGFEGVKALYSFEDITKVRVDQDPQMTGSTTGFSASPAAKPENAVQFQLAKAAGVSTLTITFPDKPGDVSKTAPAEGGPDMSNPQMLAMMKSMFDGFKVAIDMEVLGTIVKTDADYVDGSKITLLEMDFAQLLQDEAKLKQIQSKVKPGASISEVKPYLKDVKGIKINNPVVTVVYR